MPDAVLKRKQTGDQNVIAFELPKSLQNEWWGLVKKSPEYLRVKIERPHKKRTTGDLSQNHRCYFCLNLLAEHTGHEVAELKMLAKYQAIKRGYPYRWIKVWNPEQQKEVDQIEPKHEYELSTIECGYLIDELEKMCAENDIDTGPAYQTPVVPPVNPVATPPIQTTDSELDAIANEGFTLSSDQPAKLTNREELLRVMRHYQKERLIPQEEEENSDAVILWLEKDLGAENDIKKFGRAVSRLVAIEAKIPTDFLMKHFTF